MGSGLSVALCTYNGGEHLAEQLESLLLQRRIPDEVVVGDDDSTDGTLGHLQRFALRAPFPVHIRTDRRIGPNANFARTIARCTGDLVALCDQDDRWDPDRLAVGEAALAASPASMLAFSDARLIGGKGQPLGRTLWQSIGIRRATLTALAHDPLAALLRRPMVTGCTVTFRRELLDVALPFPPGEHLQHDRWLAQCASASGPLVAIPRTLVDYRVHPTQHTGLGPLSSARHRPRGRFHWSRWRNLRRRSDERLRPLAEQAEALQERLPPGGPEHDRARQTLDDCRALFEVRESLPARRRERLRPVLRAASAGQYRRFSTGWVAVAVDLLRP